MSFASDFSLEATRPGAAEIAALAQILKPGTPVFLTAVPTTDTQELVAAASALRKAGLEPVAHIAARRLTSAAHLEDLLIRLRGEAAMRRLLVIGGDVDTSGPFADALSVIQKGRLREAGIEEIAIGGYPEGHPRIAPQRLEAALDQKIAAARAAGLSVTIVSQFSFSGERILAWLKQLRACGIAVPVKIGLAGPASVTGLLRYARRCGVAASMRGLMSGAGSGLIGQVSGSAGPDLIIETLAAAGDLNAAPHYFSFGGIVETARYACEAAAGRIAAGHAMAQAKAN
ncbi:MAG: methylenetetrahydrofolate reductase [Pseudolabrys sp.]